MNEGWRARFFTVWIGQAFSLFGSSLVDFALIWWLTEVTGSETILALSSLVSLVPTMLLGPFAGSLIDRFDRKKVMILADGAIALVTLILLFCFMAGVQQIWMIFMVLFLRSLGGAFHRPAMMASTALMVPSDQLTRVGGMNRILTGAMQIVAPVLGAMLIDLFDVESILLIDIVTAMIAVGTLLVVAIPNPESQQTAPNIWLETMDGIRYLKSAKNICFVVLTCTSANFFCGPVSSFRPLLITDVYGGGAAELGYVSAVYGAGLLIGGFIISIWGGFKRNLITSGFGWGGLGVFLIILAFLGRGMFPAVLLCFLLQGVFMSIGGAPLDAFYQTYVPDEVQGRVFSLLNTLDNLTVPLGLITAAIAGDRLPVQFWFLMMGVCHVALCIAWAFSKQLKAAEEVEPPRKSSQA